MNFSTAVKTCLLKYASFEGRASRSEYWYFLLFDMAIFFAAIILARFSNWFLVLAALGYPLVGRPRAAPS
jgi:uncharacterized membrane protein YhaH (DUF805 family)